MRNSLVYITVFIALTSCSYSTKESSEISDSTLIDTLITREYNATSEDTTSYIEGIESEEISLKELKALYTTKPVYTANEFSFYHRMLVLIDGKNEFEAVFCIVDPEAFHICIEGLDEGRGFTIESKIEDSDIVLGSGFVKSFYPLLPTGLLKIDSRIISNLSVSKQAYTGIVIEANGKLEFTNKYEFSDINYESGFQIGPVMFQHGKLGISEEEPIKNQPFNRSFIGRLDNGNIILGITLNKIHLYDLSILISREVKLYGRQIVDLYNLSGGGSEGFAIKIQGDVYLFGNTQLEQASLIVCRRAQ